MAQNREVLAAATVNAAEAPKIGYHSSITQSRAFGRCTRTCRLRISYRAYALKAHARSTSRILRAGPRKKASAAPST